MILGASTDGAAANKAFRAKHEFPFPLLCDTDRKLSIAYGAADDAKAPMARRAAVVIDGDGKIRNYWAKVDARGFPQELLDLLAPKKEK